MNAARSFPQLCSRRQAAQLQTQLRLQKTWQHTQGTTGFPSGSCGHTRKGSTVMQATPAGSNGTTGSQQPALISWLSYQGLSTSRCLHDSAPSMPPMSTDLPAYASQAGSSSSDPFLRAALQAQLLQQLVAAPASSVQPSGNGNSPHASGSAHAHCVDAIVVLAGGLTDKGGVPPWAARRLDAAADLHKLCAVHGRQVPILCLGSGTPHKPSILGHGGHVVHEATACSRYLHGMHGVALDAMLKEVASYDTVGNAYFSMTIHAIPAAWCTLAVVTSDFHMPRTRDLFEACYGLAGQTLWGDAGRTQLLMLGVTDEGLFSNDVLAARLSKEAAAQASWRDTASQLHSLRDLHAWLHATHMCYAVQRQEEWGAPTQLDPRLLASY